MPARKSTLGARVGRDSNRVNTIPEAKIFTSDVSGKSNVTACILCSILGMFGAHRFYTGRVTTGLLQFITFGGLMVWSLIDWFAIVGEKFKDNDGKYLWWPIGKRGQHAGFKIRLCAHFIDASIVAISVLLLNGGALIFSKLSGYAVNFEYWVDLLINLIYYSAYTASKKHATIGKQIVGIKIVHQGGKKISVERAVVRTFSYVFSYLTLGIGFFMAGWTKEKVALHDVISSTYVVYNR
jgi:uncharacterized RDD family membrane protein YckC/TM2 domain-containing membrane protein YozV